MAESDLCPQFTFDEFVTGTSNVEAYNAAFSIANCECTERKPLSICGWDGLGKTHLLHAIGNEIKLRQSSRDVQYCSLKLMLPAIQGKNGQSFDLTSRVSRWMDADTLLIDDLDLLQCSDFPQPFFFKILEYAIEEDKQIVFGTKVPIVDFVDSSEVMSKCWISGTNVLIHVPDCETRLAMLKMVASEEGVDCPVNVILALAKRDAGNFKDIVSGLYLLWFESRLRDIPITLEMFNEVLGTTAVDEI